MLVENIRCGRINLPATGGCCAKVAAKLREMEAIGVREPKLEMNALFTDPPNP
jgi:hypothetical protein